MCEIGDSERTSGLRSFFQTNLQLTSEFIWSWIGQQAFNEFFAFQGHFVTNYFCKVLLTFLAVPQNQYWKLYCFISNPHFNTKLSKKLLLYNLLKN